MSAIQIILLTIVIISCSIKKNEAETRSNPNLSELVSNEKTAISIAEAIWEPIYGPSLEYSKPYIATPTDSSWIVEGTLDKDELGGVPFIEIRKKNAEIINIGHGK